MRRFGGFLLAVLALLSAACSAEEAFVFENGVGWPLAADEVEALLPNGYERMNYEMGFGSLTLMLAQNEAHFEHAAEKTEYMFFDGELISICCYYLEKDAPDAQSLIDAVSRVYGAPKTYAEDEWTLNGFISNTRTWCSWNPDSVTEVSLNEPLDDYPYQYYIVFVNQPAMKAFEKASIEWYDSEDAGIQGEE